MCRVVLVVVGRARVEVHRVLIIFGPWPLRFWVRPAVGWRLKSEQRIHSGLVASVKRLDALPLEPSALECHVVLGQERIQSGVRLLRIVEVLPLSHKSSRVLSLLGLSASAKIIIGRVQELLRQIASYRRLVHILDGSEVVVVALAQVQGASWGAWYDVSSALAQSRPLEGAIHHELLELVRREAIPVLA